MANRFDQLKHTYPCHRQMRVADLIDGKYPDNPRVVTPEGLKQLDEQIEALGNIQPVTWNVRTKRLLGGNQRVELYAKRGDKTTDVWCVDLPEEKERSAVLALNNHAGEYDIELLKRITEAINAGDNAEELMAASGFAPGELEQILSQTEGDGTSENQKQEAHKKLSERFLLPPFSVLDARQGYWQDRKRLWLALGIKSELGRGSQPSTSARADIPATRQRGNAATRQRGNNKSDGDEENSKRQARLSPGGSPRPAMNYSKRERGDGSGKPIKA